MLHTSADTVYETFNGLLVVIMYTVAVAIPIVVTWLLIHLIAHEPKDLM